MPRKQTLAQYRSDGDGGREEVDQSAAQTEPVEPAWAIADQYSVRDVADALISDHYPDLHDAALLYVFEAKQHMKGGRVVAARTIKLTPLQRFLASGLEDAEGGYDFVVILHRKSWLAHTDQRWREATLDTALAYCELEQTEEGNDRWKIRQPDFAGFVEVLQRQGAWDEQLQQMAETVQQLPLPMGVGR